MTDAQARERFITGLHSNFSVQASAGAGKTTALVQRIAHLAEHEPGMLSQLVVVTYTNRAADEMRQRLRDKVLELQRIRHNHLLTEGLSRQFIGTLHSFCLKLIREFALGLGYPPDMQSAPENDPALFEEFQRTRAPVPHDPAFQRLYRVLPARDLQEIAMRLSRLPADWSRFSTTGKIEPLDLLLDVSELEGITAVQARSQKFVDGWTQAWRILAAAWNEPGEGHVHIPKYDEKGGAAMKAAWPRALAKLEGPLLIPALLLAAREAAAFQEFRFSRGQLYFSDQVVLAGRLLQDAGIRSQLRSRGYRILLDEAQDTDPLQFRLLTELARPVECEPFTWGPSPDKTLLDGPPPRPGHFVMVGDRQQAIYRDRADLALYRGYHNALCQSEHGEELVFSLTYRCRPGIVSFVNDRFSHVLDGLDGQAEFEPLQALEERGSGQAIRWNCPPQTGNTAMRGSHEARWIARKLKSAGPAALRIPHWGEAAILCPTRKWLSVMKNALAAEGIPSTLHFDVANFQDPEFLWFTSILSLHTRPYDDFENAGVLREIYGISDPDIARYRLGPEKRTPLTVSAVTDPRHAIDHLRTEWHMIREAALQMPLAQAVRYWCEQTRLAERLGALPGGADHIVGLERWIARAHDAQKRESSLTEWVEYLRQNIETSRPSPPSETEHAISLMTIKKAKGLEWNAVILPFLGSASKEGGKAEYPRILMPLNASAPELLLANRMKTTGWEEAETADNLRAKQEWRRLHYVAATRARHTLVLIDDAPVWMKKEKLTSPNGYDGMTAAAEDTGFTNPLDPSAQTLGSEPAAEEIIQKKAPPVSQPTDIASWPIPADPASWPSIKRQRPSSHEETPEDAVTSLPPEPERDPAFWIPPTESEAIIYGLWWHDAMEFWPWQDSPSQQESAARTRLDMLPPSLRDRGARELEQWFAHPLRVELQDAGAEFILREIPYLRAPEPGVAEEGKLDLLFRRKSGAWTLLDWKTDGGAAFRDLVPKLKQRYSSQLAAYALICKEAGLPVERKLIYSTVFGRTIELG